MTLTLRLIVGVLIGLISYGYSLVDMPANWLTFLAMTALIFLLGLQLHFVKQAMSKLAWLLGLSIIYGLLLTYVITQYEHYLLQVSLLSPALISLYITYIFYCAKTDGECLHYQRLFYYAWQKFLLVLLGEVLVYLILGLFFLAGLLFKILGSDFVYDLVLTRSFHLTIPPILFALAIYVFSQNEGVIDKTRDLLLSFFKVLYPLFAIVTLIFTVGVWVSPKPISDLWGIIVLLSAWHIFMLNAVYQDGTRLSPYPAWMSWILGLVVFLLPFYLIGFFYFPITKIQSVGLHYDSYIALITLLILSLYSVAYLFALFIKEDGKWLPAVGRFNIYLAMFSAIIFLLMASPVLSPKNVVNHFNPGAMDKAEAIKVSFSGQGMWG